MERNIRIFTGPASEDFAQSVVDHYGDGVVLERCEWKKFADGERKPIYPDTIRGAELFIIQNTHMPIDNFWDLLVMIDTAKRNSAAKVTAVVPYLHGQRGDKKDEPRSSLMSKVVANMLTAAQTNRLITFDLHADQNQQAYDFPVDHIYASHLFINYIKTLGLKNFVIAAADPGATKKASHFAKALEVDFVIVYKDRPESNAVKDFRIIGNVEGKYVISVDDMVDTAGTMTGGADAMIAKGAREVLGVATHPVLSGPAYERIMASKMTRLLVADTLPMRQQCSKIERFTVAPLTADVIKSVYHYKSISKLFTS